jgi:O-antigen/teichoic acid export membrane protein
LVGLNTGASESGAFFGLQRLTEISTEIGLAISVVMLSVGVRSSSNDDTNQNSARVMRVSILVFAGMSLLLVVFSNPIIRILLGEDYIGHVSLFPILILGTFIGTVWTMLFPSLSLVTSPLYVLKLFTLCFIVNLLITFPLTYYHGIHGGAWSTVIVNAFTTGIFLASYWKKFSIPATSFLFIRFDDVNFEKLIAAITKFKSRWKS